MLPCTLFVVLIGGRNCNNWKTSVWFPLLALNYYTGRCSVADHGWCHHICHCIFVPYFCNSSFNFELTWVLQAMCINICPASSAVHFLLHYSTFVLSAETWKNSGVNWQGKQLWSLRGLAYPDIYWGERGKVMWIQPKCS